MIITKGFATFLFVTLFLAAPVRAETVTVGGDVFAAGADAVVDEAAGRDAFASGFSAALNGDVTGDGHAAGFDVDVDGTIGADLYAVGGFVSVAAPVGEDVTASGFSVRLRPGADVGGNARLTAGRIEVDAPVAGSLMAAGGRIRLNAPVSGDVRLTGGDIGFGGSARIDGELVYAAPEEIDIPEGVIAAERVRFIQLASDEGLREMREALQEPGQLFWPSFFAMLWGFIVSLAFLTALGAILIAFAPRLVAEGYGKAHDRPGPSILLGFLALATLFGLVPVSAMTIIGIPLIPVVILFIVASWMLAYLLGTYSVALRLGSAFGFDAADNTRKLLALFVGLVVMAMLNFIPLLGWLINFVVVLLGLGAIALMIVDRFGGRGSAVPAAAPADTGPSPTDGSTDDGGATAADETGGKASS
ncbi:MAG: hypothetical protein RIB53_04705 [Roseitalea porphyridii]|jgi:hypothetical protein|uniref:hypothetical protein n=1 Tax=Roseitalea porphyridii TaxID=1852022 RepID=UPI0032EC5154